MINLQEHLQSIDKEVVEIAQSVFVIKNFFTDEDFEPIWALIKNADPDDWHGSYRKQQELLALKKFNRTDIDNLIAEGVMEYTDNWVDKNLKLPEDIGSLVNTKLQDLFSFTDKLHISNFEAIQRQYPGTELVEHVDNYGHPQIEFAAIAYLNDDYEGGELFFSKLGLEIKPPAGSLVIFASGDMYMHGVKSVEDGPVRYCLPTFLYHFIDS